MTFIRPKAMAHFDMAIPHAGASLKQLKEEGKKIVGYYCMYAPQEIALAAGAIPVSLCATKEEPIADGEKSLPRNFCPLIKSSYGFAVTDKCPFFLHSDIIIGETTCDGKKENVRTYGEFQARSCHEVAAGLRHRARQSLLDVIGPSAG